MSFSETIQRLNTPQMDLYEALDQVEQNCNDEWFDNALKIVRELCETGEELTTDDVWLRIKSIREPRAMGAVMTKAAKYGWIESTDRVVKSKRPACHRRPIAIWRSCLYSF